MTVPAIFRRITAAGWMGVLLTACGGLGFMLFGWRELLAAATASCALLASAIVMTCGGIDCHVTVKPETSRLVIGAASRITVGVRNPGKRRIRRLRAWLAVDSGRVPISVPGLPSGGETTITLPFVAESRGATRVGPLHVYRGDPLGLARRERQLAGFRTIIVHPPAIPLSDRRSDGLSDPDGSPDGRAAADGLTFRGLRDYMEGDDVRRIHWPSSAKTGTPVVRESESTRRDDLCVVLDDDAGHYRDAAAFECAVSVLASIGVHALERSHTLTVCCGRRHTRPDSAERLLDACAAIPPLSALGRDAARGGEEDTHPAWWYGWTAAGRTTTAGLPSGSRYRITGLRPETDAEAAMASVMFHVKPGAKAGLMRIGTGPTLATIGSLEDLPAIWEALP